MQLKKVVHKCYVFLHFHFIFSSWAFQTIQYKRFIKIENKNYGDFPFCCQIHVMGLPLAMIAFSQFNPLGYPEIVLTKNHSELFKVYPPKTFKSAHSSQFHPVGLNCIRGVLSLNYKYRYWEKYASTASTTSGTKTNQLSILCTEFRKNFL